MFLSLFQLQIVRLHDGEERIYDGVNQCIHKKLGSFGPETRSSITKVFPNMTPTVSRLSFLNRQNCVLDDKDGNLLSLKLAHLSTPLLPFLWFLVLLGDLPPG